MEAFLKPRVAGGQRIQLSMMSEEEAPKELDEQLAEQRAAASWSRARSRSSRGEPTDGF